MAGFFVSDLCTRFSDVYKNAICDDFPLPCFGRCGITNQRRRTELAGDGEMEMLLVDNVKTMTVEALKVLATEVEAGGMAYWIIWDEIDYRAAA